jgi:hypothetical protein
MVRVVIPQIVLHLQQEQHTFKLFDTSRPAVQSTQPIVRLLHTLSSCANKKNNNRCCITMISSQCTGFVAVLCHQINDNTLRRLSQSSLNLLAAVNTRETQPA